MSETLETLRRQQNEAAERTEMSEALESELSELQAVAALMPDLRQDLAETRDALEAVRRERDQLAELARVSSDANGSRLLSNLAVEPAAGPADPDIRQSLAAFFRDAPSLFGDRIGVDELTGRLNALKEAEAGWQARLAAGEEGAQRADLEAELADARRQRAVIEALLSLSGPDPSPRSPLPVRPKRRPETTLSSN
ncbi:MAG: hypothetical protein ACFB6S_12600 [Geminicoccaceae bacterium]